MATRKRPSSPPVRLRRVATPTHNPNSCFLANLRLKYALTAGAITIILLTFAATWRRVPPGGCNLCMHGGGEVREVPPAVDETEELEAAEDEEEGAVAVAVPVSHREICPTLYHERQSARFDLLHALNNLMQGDHPFTRLEMDHIAESLGTARILPSVFKKHYNVFTGNYDMQVLRAAAVSRGKTLLVFDDAQRLKALDLSGYGDRLVGLIAHVQRRLWVTVRRYGDFWYNFDSTRPAPLVFCNGEVDLQRYLARVVEQGGEIVIVLNPPTPAPLALAEERTGFMTNIWNFKTRWLGT